jgi:HEAT repeat protein
MKGRCCAWTVLIAVLALIFLPQEASPAPLANFDAALSQFTKDLADKSLPVSQRVEIIRAMSGWATPEVRQPLLEALKDPAPEIRGIAALVLGWPGNREAIGPLQALVESPEEPVTVKASALEAVGAIGDPASRPLLVASTRHGEARIRQASLTALAFGPLADPADRVTYLLQIAEDTALQGLLRCDALRELFGVNEDRVVDALVRIIQNEPRFALALPEGGGNIQQVMEIRRIQMRDVAAWAASGLGELGAKRTLPLLARTAEDRSDFFLRLTSLRAVAALGLAEGREVFVRRLDDPVPEVRLAALVALEQLGDRTVAPMVRTRLTDLNGLVRAQTVRTLGVLGDASLRPVLEDLQTREIDSNVQYAIDEALRRLPR